MKMMMVKRVLNKRLGYELVEDAYGHYGVFDRWGTLIRYFLSKEELYQFIKMIRLLGIL